ncbi:MAG: hypothetical protein ACYTFA_00400 [Planctomycetota bacterium]|jgi:hypothetical protein
MKYSIGVSFMLAASAAFAADVVPNEIQQPGTQPGQIGNLESPNKCDNCHGGYDAAWAYSNEPAYGWRGGAMGNAGRDPIFWATLAIAEQDFDGAGDLCIRCHSTGGWYAGRSTPTDGSGLAASDDNGVDCDTCHKITNPNDTEHLGVMNPPFVANDPITGEGYYGSGILSLWGSSDKLGPYTDAEARHQWMASQFHRGDLCGSCHDVSNPAVGDLAPNHGTQLTADAVISSYDFPPLGTPNLGGPLEEKAAFNNPPYKYGIVERTFSEWKAGALDDMSVTNFPNLPPGLQAQNSALRMAYESAMLAGGTYADGTIRTFSCQSCHMRPDIGEGCNKNVQTRPDLPKHDQTGGNYWMWPLIKYQDLQGTLRLGGGLTQLQLEAIDAGQIRAQDQLKMAASLTVSGNTVRITNFTGHKLITGYPEGRRMWLNIKWYDTGGGIVREDGAYGGLAVTFANPVDNTPFEPQSIRDLHDPNTKIYEAHYAVTQEWAATLMAVNPTLYGPIVLSYDRLTGSPGPTIGDLAAQPAGSYHETFHFVLNNYVSYDNRIPPYGMDYETARMRNALPVPDSQYGGGAAAYDGYTNVYEYWDEVQLSPPAGATGADIALMYQGTSWEYVQFLWKANNQQNAFLGQEGVNFLDAWIKAAPTAPMVPPFVMAAATWGDICTPTEPTEITCDDGVDNDCDGFTDGDDPDCQCTPGEPTEVTCDDGLDNDCDGLIDGDDPDCPTITCSDYSTKAACNADPACEWQGSPKNGTCVEAVICTPTSPDEVTLCGDGVDNDCDGLTDCADSDDCGGDPICQVDCSAYTTKNLCNAQPACSWDNKNRTCVNN